MLIYRITRRKYSHDLSGNGAAKSTINRWNNRGVAMVYTSESEALARAELAGHINLNLLPDAVLIVIEVPDELVKVLEAIPEDFDRIPPGFETKDIGDQFVREAKYIGMKVPSRYDSKSFNLLLNPKFQGFSELVRIVEMKDLK